MSGTLGPCCYQGVKHEGSPRGRLATVDDLEIYVTEPSHASTWSGKGILYLTDIVGHTFINAQLLADQFAENGYKVIIPDLFDGDPVPLNTDMVKFDLDAWMQGKLSARKTPHTPQFVKPVVETALQYLVGACDCKTIAVTGYCFGAKYAVQLAADDRVSAVCIAHPAMVDREEFRRVNTPLAMVAAETDHIFPAEQRDEAVAILAETGHPWQMNLYSGVTHGFAVRCDPKVDRERYAKESAFFLAVHWFDEYLRE